MRFKEETQLPMIGDKYDITNFDGMIFVWPKLEEVTTFEELNELCRPEPVHFERVMQTTGSDLQLDQRPMITNAYLGIQVSSKYMREQYRKFIAEKIVGDKQYEVQRRKLVTCN